MRDCCATLTLALLFTTAIPAQDAALGRAIRDLAAFEVGGDRAALNAIEAAVATPTVRRQLSRGLLDLLRDGDASVAARQFAAQKLELVAGEDAVPRLVAAFSDEVAGPLAAGVLVRIPGDSVTDAIRAALDAAPATVKLLLIPELARRRDARAVPLLAPFLAQRNFDLLRAAARALGEIHTADAERALRMVLRDALSLRRQEFATALMCHAHARLARGKPAAAAAIFQPFTVATELRPVRLIAYRGLALARGARALPQLLVALLDQDDRVGELAAQEIPRLHDLALDQATTTRLTRAASRTSARIILIEGFIRRGNADALGFMRSLLGRRGPDARLRADERAAALRGLVALRGAAAVPELVGQLAAGDRSDVRVVEALLARMQGARVDYQISVGLRSGELRPPARLALVGALAQRRSDAAASTLAVVAEKDKVFGVRLAALRALARFSGELDLEGARRLLESRTTEQERRHAQALVDRLSR